MSMGYCSSAPVSLTPPRETKGGAGCAWITASAAMTSDGFVTGLSLAMTRPASIADLARARLSNSPRSTSTRSARLRGGRVLSAFAGISTRRARGGGCETLRCQPHAGLERRQIVPDIRRRLPRRDQRAAMQVERVNHHQIIRKTKILDRQSLGVGEMPGARCDGGVLRVTDGVAG